MSSKTVKVTNGKIVNYTITAPGYKTINGSQLITADTTINKNMIAETDPNGVYSLGDRIGGCASFVCYFNSTNPETNVDQKYAVFVLDAKYRSFYEDSIQLSVSGLPKYSSSTAALDAKESATYNTDFIINSSDNNTYFLAARNAATIFLGGVTYSSQFPNIYEMQQIYNNKTVLNSIDTTASDYPNHALDYNRILYYISSTEAPSGTAQYRYFINTSSGSIGSTWSTNRALVIPVFEIPVN